jgi:hypothetical protein
MVDERWAMHDGFNDTVKHSAEWVRITNEFLKLAFAGGRCEASCPCSRCENRRMLSEYEMSAHLAKKGFISNYLLWHQHGEVKSAVADESDENDDVDRMDDMIADIGRGYDLEYEDPPPDEHNFYSLHVTSQEKVHDGIDMTMLQAVTRLMEFKSKYSFLNQCYNDIVNLIIDLIPAKHHMPKYLYQSKKIVSGLEMNYEKIDAYEQNCMLFWKEHKDDTECIYCGRSRYMKVINKDGTSVTTKVAVKQLCYIPITPRLKQLLLCKKWRYDAYMEIHDDDDVVHVYQEENEGHQILSSTVSDRLELTELATRDVELMEKELGPSKKHLQKSK